MLYAAEDTICAIATPAGQGSIGVIRVSGSNSFTIVDRCLDHRRACHLHRGFSLHRAKVVERDDIVDDVLVAVFHCPASYTGEDLVEISCHGGVVPLRRTLKQILSAGARMAEPGEFTKRAYLNGKMDLVQAEAVCDLIMVRTDDAHRQALEQQHGALSSVIHKIRDQVLGLLARVEASIDFPEDVGEFNNDTARRELQQIHADLTQLLQTSQRGIMLREGVRVALVGRPNVGKSSLMNALLRTDRSIVTPIAGTTRDVIEESLDVDGLALRLIDTAGMRDSLDIVEKLGVERSRGIVAQADLVLIIVDAQVGLTAEDMAIVRDIPESRRLIVWNKADLNDPGPNHIAVSAKTLAGINLLEEAIKSALMGSADGREQQGATLTQARHARAVQQAVVSISQAIETLDKSLPADLLAIDFQAALTALGAITGETTADDIINEIFSRFCIGK